MFKQHKKHGEASLMVVGVVGAIVVVVMSVFGTLASGILSGTSLQEALDTLNANGYTAYADMAGNWNITGNVTQDSGQGSDWGLNRLGNVSDPTDDQDAATKNYVDLNEVVGLPPATAYVIASDAPIVIQTAAQSMKAHYGDLIQICDGTADQTEIQTAIDTVYSAGGGIVHLSQGTFLLNKITPNLSLQSQIAVKSLVTLEGEGKGTVIKLNDSLTCPQESAIIAFHTNVGGIVTSYDNCMVRNLQIDGNKASVGSSFDGIFWFNTYYGTVKDCYVNNCSGNGIQPYGAGGRHIIENNYVDNCGVIGIYVDTVKDCTVSGNIVNGSGYDNIWLDWSYNISVVGNVCIGGHYSIGFVRGSSYNTVIGNDFYNADTRAVDFEGVLRISQYNTVSGNSITPKTGASAVYIGSTNECNHNVISDNIMYVTGTTAAIYIAKNSSNNSIMGNQIYTANGYSLNITSGSLSNTFMDNVLQSVSNQYVTDAGTSTLIRDNTGYITENSGIATVLNTSTSVVVNHGLGTTPIMVQITPRENPTNAVSFWWVDTLTSSQFTIHINADCGASNLDFDWRAVTGGGN